MKKNKKSDNPLHTEYGILSNSAYILKKIRHYCPSVPWIMLVGVLTNSLMQYLWSFIGKFVIDIAEAQAASPDKDIAPLVKLVVITTVIELAAMGLNDIVNSRRWFKFIFIRGHLITERIKKVLSMNYQSLEKPAILDMYQKACNATGSNDNGVEGMMHSVYNLTVQLVLLVVTVTAVSVLDPVLILVLAAVSGVRFLFFRHTVQKDKKEVWDPLASSWRKINYMERTTQDFDYAKDIRLFNMKDWLSEKQHGIIAEKQQRIIRSKDLWINNSVFGGILSVVSSAAIYGILIFKVLDINMSIGNFTLFLGLAQTFLNAARNFLEALGGFKKNSLETDDFRSFLELPEEEGDFLPVPEGCEYVFEFKNVSFKYDGAEDYALKNLNLTLSAGKKIAVVGLNGAGKTTFIKLLLRLYDVTEGEILLNGTNIKRFRRADYYRLFSPVFQNVEVFAFPLGENISMKRPEETDKRLAEQCAEKAGMGDKLKNLPKGIDTELLKVICDDGVDLSGGEKQKLALARALYKNAPVIVLDEPTAALDALAEYSLYKSFNEIIGGKTAVYISHRLSSTRFCDSIAMFKDGEMIEYGTHGELLEKKGAYSEMFEIQAQYYRDKKEEAYV